MDLCRGTQEVEAVLSESGNKDGSTPDPLARLKMALEYEEKKVLWIIVTTEAETKLSKQKNNNNFHILLISINQSNQSACTC